MHPTYFSDNRPPTVDYNPKKEGSTYRETLYFAIVEQSVTSQNY